MEIRIFDVAHGFCAWVIADNGNSMLIDCGHNDETNFHPANYLLANGCTGIQRLFVTNYDEDHVSGLPRLRSIANRMPIHILHRNTSITPTQLRALKQESGPLGPGITSLLQMMEYYVSAVMNPPDFGRLSFQCFYNNYPTFRDTNNLSLVLFLKYPGLSIIFPGDLETDGWESLLINDSFQQHLARVNIFVASHHGRESGYAAEVFDFCQPAVVVISDESIQYDTQEEIDYGVHATGIRWSTGETRRVLTTRNDGMITIKADGLGRVRIETAVG